jgi:hypothetical protein
MKAPLPTWHLNPRTFAMYQKIWANYTSMGAIPPYPLHVESSETHIPGLPTDVAGIISNYNYW